jgi:hypothetical protein
LVVELFVDGHIAFRPDRGALDAAEIGWLDEIAIPELQRERREAGIDHTSAPPPSGRASANRPRATRRRRTGASLLVLSKPFGRPLAMTDREIDAWAEQVFLGMRTQLKRAAEISREESYSAEDERSKGA